MEVRGRRLSDRLAPHFDAPVFYPARAMQIDSPTWHLRESCPVCGQGTSLLLVKCWGCGEISIECTEEGSQFADARLIQPPERWRSEGSAKCPHCDAMNALRPASAEEIQASGIVIGRYE